MSDDESKQALLRAGLSAEDAVAMVAEQDVPPVDAVAVAYVHSDEVKYAWHHSMSGMLGYDARNHGRIWAGGYVAIRCGTDGLADARNTAVREFLKDSAAEWLFWIDTDMGFEPDTVDRLLEAADPQTRPIVGGLCFAQREQEPDGMGGWRCLATPTIFDWAQDGDHQGFAVRWDYPQNTVARCSGTGSACILIHRSVFEKIRAKYGEAWYERARNPSTGTLISEDLSFCVRAMALDIPIFVHTGVQTTHVKKVWLGSEDYWRQRALNPPPERPDAPMVPQPARTWTVPRYAIVPTHNRPMRLLSLVVSLGAQVDTIVVVDNASTPPVNVDKLRGSVPPHVTVEVIRDEEQPPHLSRFWNDMLDRCAALAKERGQDVWDVGVFNDDSVVPGGWFDATAGAMRAHPSAAVCFTDTFGRQPQPTLMTELDTDPMTRMCPWAFVVRGEGGLRADEQMRWWFFDTDLDLRARMAGGVLSVPGPRVVNAHANSTTVGVLAAQAQRDQAVFEAKWVEQ